MDKIENLTPLTTIKHSVGNTAETLLADVTGYVNQYGGKNVVKAFITCETHSIRYAWGANPTVDGGTAFGHVLAAGGYLQLTGHKLIADFRFVNKVSGSVAVIHITPSLSV